jgi:hypothetical protein
MSVFVVSYYGLGAGLDWGQKASCNRFYKSLLKSLYSNKNVFKKPQNP